jgi:hypothetical protein
VQLASAGKPLARGELGAVVEHRIDVFELLEQARHFQADVPAPADEDVRDGAHVLHEDLYCPAAQAVQGARAIEGQLVFMRQGPLLGDGQAAEIFDLLLEAGPADGAELGAVRAHDHLGAHLPGDAAPGGDHGAQSEGLAAVEQLGRPTHDLARNLHGMRAQLNTAIEWLS